MTSGGDKPQEACGVVGIYAPGQEVAKLTYNALLALQHRGQESAGITVADNGLMTTFKEMGLVAQVFNENVLNSLTGDVAIGHVRYSTTGSSTWENAQPIYRHKGKLGAALGHNGNLVNTMQLASDLAADGAGLRDVSNDSDLIAEMIVTCGKPNVEEGILDTLPKLQGAFSLVILDDHTVFGARDPHGLRPLVLGALGSTGYALASETCALDTIGATFIREVEPGEMVVIDGTG
ncbi:MAG TPA: amidophosphoribosyltransferase, partial [Actinomycetota bacterium]|nr:amidophosphoribosyltransferase [Actinomycetota bacterium]